MEPPRPSFEDVYTQWLEVDKAVAPHQWIRFMIRVCRENPCLPPEVAPLIDVAEQYHFGTGLTDADVTKARVAAWQCEVAEGRDPSSGRLRNTEAIDSEGSYAAYHAVRGLICLLWTFDNFIDFEDSLMWFDDFVMISIRQVAPDFEHRIIEIFYECFDIALEQTDEA